MLSNASMPGAVKIGYTKSTPDERAKQLSSSTGVASPFVVEHAFQCFNAEALESELHSFFQEFSKIKCVHIRIYFILLNYYREIVC